jgi:hypothetical protein
MIQKYHNYSVNENSKYKYFDTYDDLIIAFASHEEVEKFFIFFNDDILMNFPEEYYIRMKGRAVSDINMQYLRYNKKRGRFTVGYLSQFNTNNRNHGYNYDKIY